MTGLPPASIVIEWSNALLAEAERPSRMIKALREQADALRADWGRDPKNHRFFPLQVLICFDSEQVTSEEISRMAPSGAPGDHGALRIRHCGYAGAEYYELKNRGAEEANCAVLLFLDSDVVPQPGWLENLWGTFRDPGYRVVGGISFVETGSLWAKATALNWVFELPPDWTEIRPAKRFWANNVAFRRNIFTAHSYPRMEGASRGACEELAGELAAEGIPMHINGSVRVEHPAPAGLSGFFERAMAQGRDRVLWHRRFSSWWMQSMPAGLLRWVKHLAQVAWRTLQNHRQARVRVWEIPLVIAISWAYYTVFLAGEWLMHLAPDYMRRHFRV